MIKNIDGFQMQLNPKDGGISKILSKKGARELCFMWILRKESGGGLGVDVGANIGYTTLNLCKNMDKVIAIEPDPRSLKLLRKNIQLNSFENKTTIHDFAMSDENGSTTMRLAKRPNLSTTSQKAMAGNVSGKDIKIMTRTFDDLNILPNFIKMDIEGSEVEVLNGAMESLAKTEHCKILIETHQQFYNGNAFEKVLKKLVKIGFRIKYVVSAGVPRPDLFKKHGYNPLKNAPINRRAVYSDLSQDHAINWASHPITQKCPGGKDSSKIIRSILLVK